MDGADGYRTDGWGNFPGLEFLIAKSLLWLVFLPQVEFRDKVFSGVLSADYADSSDDEENPSM